ncbi:MAG: type III pantothenate kinase [Phaeodactylibacter sp.]|nr:type III pantothenate kinase [Phaeodactylibacter sp.]MCB9263923.1 type III pantothenate kinase [Lewinellaceae bacterium]MCB9288151.1 type III pantothenate kinase [Lewinellaceae bacterium]
MLLAIDIGNSNVTFGLARGSHWKHTWRLPTMADGEALLYYEVQITNFLLENDILAEEIQQTVISTVVPALRATFEKLAFHLFRTQPILVGPEVYPRLRLRVTRPEELGTDLYANAVAAHYLFKQDCIITDFGTALTFTTINAAGELLGVSIAPGLKTAISSLFQKTAQLPEVPLELPASAVGKNTVHAIQSGILIGYVGLVRHLLQAIREELGQQYIAVATGGLSSILHPLKKEFHSIEPNLTLDGLRLIGEEIGLQGA